MNIKIYSTPNCAYCKMAKEFFTENNYQVQEFNVILDVKAREEMVQKSNQMGVPVIDIDGEIFVGFNRAALKEALKLKWASPQGT